MSNYKLEKKWVDIITLTIIVVVASLGSFRGENKLRLGEWTHTLPDIYGHLNLLTAGLLIVALIAIRKGKVNLHKRLMTTSTVIGVVFLVLYILYHISNKERTYQGEGMIVYLYYFFLITHILTAVVVVRFVLLSLLYAHKEDFPKHKKIVKYSFPIWLYVSLTGYIVYALLKYS